RDAGRHLRERGLGHVREAAERIHDSPHRAEEAHVGADRAHGREEREVRLEHVHLALVGGLHRAARALQERGHVGPGAALQLEELLEARLEDALHAGGDVAAARGALVEADQVAAAPEFALELVGGALRAANGEELHEDVRPREHGREHEQRHDELHDDARVEDHREDGEVVAHDHVAASILRLSGAGISAGLNESTARQAPETRALASTSSSRRISWSKMQRTRPSDSSRTLTARLSSRRAGFTKSTLTAETANTTRWSRASAWWSKPRCRSHSVRAR